MFEILVIGWVKFDMVVSFNMLAGHCCTGSCRACPWRLHWEDEADVACRSGQKWTSNSLFIDKGHTSGSFIFLFILLSSLFVLPVSNVIKA